MGVTLNQRRCPGPKIPVLTPDVSEIARSGLLPVAVAAEEYILTNNAAAIPKISAAKTKKYFTDFFQCPGCLKIFWKGSHYDAMTEKFSQLGMISRKE